MERIGAISIEYHENANETEKEEATNEILNAVQSFVNDMIGDYNGWPFTNYGANKISIKREVDIK